MLDMTPVLIAKSDQINAADLIGASRTVTITDVRLTGKEQATEIRIADDDKVWRPNKNTVRIMSKAWTRDGHSWIGRSCTLYCDPKVKYGKDETGGIRVSHMSGLNGTLTVCLQERKGVLKTYVIEPLVAEQRPAPALEQSSEDARAKAEDWTAARILAVQNAADTEAVSLAHHRMMSGLKKLGTDHPDLAEQITAAISAKLATFDTDEAAA